MSLFKPWTWFGKLEQRLFGQDGIDGTFRSFVNQYTRNDLTGAEHQQNTFNAEQAQKQMDFEERMSNTAFQRQVSDMQTAGVNPALMYGAGSSGASTPGGALASGSANQGLGMSDLMQAVMSGATMKKELALLDAQRENVESQTEKNKADTQYTLRNTDWIDSLNQSQIDRIASEIGLNSAKISEIDFENSLRQAQELKILKETDWIDRINQAETDRQAAAAAHDWAEAAISAMEAQLGHRLGQSELLAVCTALFKTLGLNPANPIGSGASKIEDFLANEEVPLEDAIGGRFGGAIFRGIKRMFQSRER